MNYPMYNGYGMTYQPQQTYQQTQMQSKPDERIWVQSEAQAEAYLVASNGFVRLWHISEPVFYEKGCDAMGRPTPMTAYRYEKIENRGTNSPNGAIAFEDKINALERRITALEGIRGGENAEHESDEPAFADR